jgi:hypothetical protein
LTVTLNKGGRSLSLSFDPQTNAGTLQGKRFTVPRNTNVIFVDRVDSTSGPEITNTLTIRPTENIDPRKGSVAALFKSSQEIMTFLRCDAKAPSQREAPPEFKAIADRLSAGVCAELQ